MPAGDGEARPQRPRADPACPAGHALPPAFISVPRRAPRGVVCGGCTGRNVLRTRLSQAGSLHLSEVPLLGYFLRGPRPRDYV